MSDKTWYQKHSKDLGNAFLHFSNAVHKKSILDEKTKQLIMLALACTHRCPHCTEDHIKDALEAGASKEEITETLLVTAYEGAGTQLAWKGEVFEKYLGDRE